MTRLTLPSLEGADFLALVTQENPTCRQCGRKIDAPPCRRAGALLHDVGKTGIPDAILLKPGPLTQAEQELMRTHPANGHAILADIPFLQDAAQIVLSHEERFVGTQFDPAAVEAFSAEERVLREMVAVKCATEWSAVP